MNVEDRPATSMSVVMPAYNEEDAISGAVAEVATQVLDVVPGSDLIVVDDGSRDRTGPILDQLTAREPRLKVIHQPNGGHGRALRTGLDAAHGDWLLLVDSDQQIPLLTFPALWQAAQGNDGAFGVRAVRHDARLRLWLTRIVRLSVRLLFGVAIHDANVPFKLIRRSTWLEARPFIPDDTLAPSLFLAVFMRRRGMRVAEVVVQHRDRASGVVSIRRWKLLKFCWRAFRQLLTFRSRVLA